MATQEQTQQAFKLLKTVCVPLLASSLLSPASIPNVSNLLAELNNTLLNVKASGLVLTPNLISYTFFPLSTLLRRNAAPDIPDQILEKVFVVLGILCEDWWWDCDLAVWEQIFKLCGAVVAGIDRKGKERARDDETKEAAGRCLHSLLRDRTSDPNRTNSSISLERGQARLEILKAHTRTAKFVPILGQTLDSLLMAVDTPHLPLQRMSLELLALIIGTYAPDDLIPSVLPGVVSRMTRAALGTSNIKGWANGESVAGSLNVMQLAIVRAVGNDICTKEGAIQYVVDLEDLVQSPPEQREIPALESRPFSTPRTPSWLRGTSSQLLIALNTLTPLVSHPTPSALLAVSMFSAKILGATSMTLPDAQPLLLHFLLSLSNSDLPSVSAESRGSLLSLLTTSSKVQHSLQQTLLRTTNDNLLALPRLLPTHADSKVEHVAGIVEAVCRLVTSTGEEKTGLTSISTGIGKLLGPTGGIEKWGWSLLSVLELREPPITLTQTSSAQLMLESNPDASQWAPFPDVDFKNVFSASARNALERMFRALGRAGGDGCLFSVEWFASVGRSGTGSRSITATWCACRLLEGVAEVSLSQGGFGDVIPARRSKRLMKLARTLVRNISELWDDADEGEQNGDAALGNDEEFNADTLVQHVKGVNSVHETLRIIRPVVAKKTSPMQQPGLQKALSLQLLAVSAGVLQAHFTPMLIYTLYPVLRSLVSSDVYLSTTALATLNFTTVITSYASPANLLLSNFDYALDAVSRRLSRRWLDVEATKVLAVMVRLVGSDIVERAGDVVEECFDRLDEFHGYDAIVEGLIEVLGDVVNVIRADVQAAESDSSPDVTPETGHPTSMDDVLQWFSRRHERDEEDDPTDYGPALREAWGESKAADTEENAPPQEADPNADPPPTPIQALTKQIVSRSLYFLTHGSPAIRARILWLLASSVPVLPESALLPSIHYAWPFILNRLVDPESFVVSATAALVESLATHVGSFMYRRIWDDVWPKFRVLLNSLDVADATNALSRKGLGAVGTESAYTHSHRTYRSIIKTMIAAVKGVHLQETSAWEVLLAFRRFLHQEAHEELQISARDLYLGMGVKNPDTVWLALSSTMHNTYPTMQFLMEPRWDITANAVTILRALET
ncbi:hypothetical protein D9615_001285 [Tricholomella constricta]|uniref:Uncharacterized protein n=1 Tax=Tricholomella constricta TaxID=117010 RepID=A0A8H5M8J6_9AGAR|nr:hypothetical protein D9615_001285 [Tricholomella constricta]